MICHSLFILNVTYSTLDKVPSYSLFVPTLVELIMMQDINKLHILTLLGNLNKVLHASSFGQTSLLTITVMTCYFCLQRSC